MSSILKLAGNISGLNVEKDNSTITSNDLGQLQASRIISQKDNTALGLWKGTQAEYYALETISDDIIYHITDGDSGAETRIDNLTITRNTSGEIQTVGLIDANKGENPVKIWIGTAQEYETITNPDPYTVYNITDEEDDQSLPIANADRIGGIIAEPKTETDITEVKIDANTGLLYVQPTPWKFYQTALISSSTVIAGDNGELVLDLSSVLPNDGLSYLIYINVRVSTNESAGSLTNLYAYSDLITSKDHIEICSVRSNSNAAYEASGVALVPIGPARYLGLYNTGDESVVNYCRLTMYQPMILI